MTKSLKDAIFGTDDKFLENILKSHERKERFYWFFETVRIFGLILSVLFSLIVMWFFIPPLINKTVFEEYNRFLIGLAWGVVVNGCWVIIIVSLMSFFKSTGGQRAEKLLISYYYKYKQLQDEIKDNKAAQEGQPGHSVSEHSEGAEQ